MTRTSSQTARFAVVSFALGLLLTPFLASAQDAAPRVRPPGERPGRWYLGVTGTELEYGVRVERVDPRSPADLAGLERGDVIVCVEGQQVGRIGNRRVDLQDAIDRAVDGRGRVSMLVQNRRNKDLVYVNVQLERAGTRPPPSPRLTGTCTYRERIALPVGSELVVRVRERGLLGSKVVAEHRSRVFRQPPFNFQITLNEDEFDPRSLYTVEAELREDGRVTFTSERLDVLTNGNPNSVEILLRRR